MKAFDFKIYFDKSAPLSFNPERALDQALSRLQGKLKPAVSGDDKAESTRLHKLLQCRLLVGK